MIEEVLSFPKGSPLKWDAHGLAKELVTRAKTHSCSSRAILVSNKKVEEKITKLKLSNRSDAGIFAQMLLICRRRLKHRGLMLIQPGDPEWFNIKEATKHATDFCNEFGISSIKVGYGAYIEIGLGMMKNFSILKFKTLHASICNIYEAQQEIDRDKEPTSTKLAHDTYLAIVSEKTGMATGYEKSPEKYRYFIQVKNTAKEYGVSIKQYMQAQFAGFDWRGGIPDPAQLIGTKALQRLQTWAFEKNFRLGDKKRKVNFKNIKQ